MRPIAVYLPQYHPIPENDQWWGEGFTEWTSVRKAKPLFKGHYQPHVPMDGYYDLRSLETMEHQVDLANANGIKGFMFYHYWFAGKRLLDLPIDNYRFKLQRKLPYFLCWTNETWYNNWYQGDGRETLIDQTYSQEDDTRHIHFLLNYFSDPDYMKINGKPVLVVYRTDLLPDPARTAQEWNDVVRTRGFNGIYLIRVENVDKNIDPSSIGFDASMEFHPKKDDLAAFRIPRGTYESILHSIDKTGVAKKLYKALVGESPLTDLNKIIDYKSYSSFFSVFQPASYRKYPCVMPAFDNSPRRVDGKSTIFYNANPELYYRWLSGILGSFKPYSTEEDLVFINAWNEWGEGNHLEPCNQWDRQYLDYTRKAMENFMASSIAKGL